MAYITKSGDTWDMIAKEYVRKTERYEPRAKVARVEWTGGKAQDGTMTPKVVIEIV